MPHRRPLFDIAFGTLTRERTNSGDVARALRDTDRTAGIEQVEEVRRFDAELVGRKCQPLVAIRQQPFALSLERLKRGHEHRDIAFFEIIGRELDFGFVMDVSVRDRFVPGQIKDVIHLLQIHSNAFRPVCDFDRNRIQFYATDFLEVGELGNLHPIETHLPAQAPGAERGGLPVVLNEPDIVLLRVNPQLGQTLQIQGLNVVGRRFQYNLILIVVLHAIRVFTVPSIRRTPAWLGIGGPPGLWAKGPEKRGRVKGSCAHLKIIGLKNDAALLSPIVMQCEDEILEGHEQSRR
jgi:hypothetical protein